MLGGDLQGFPNGRRLTDDAVDISIQAVEGAAQTGKLVDALATGDKVDANDNAFGKAFPYVALPNQGAVNSRKGTNAGMSLGDPGPAPSTDETAPALAPASANASSETDTTCVLVVGIVGAAALLTMATAWWLMRRRRSTGDDTIAF